LEATEGSVVPAPDNTLQYYVIKILQFAPDFGLFMKCIRLTGLGTRDSQATREFAEEIFSRYDINGDNNIDVRELGFCLRALGFRFSMRGIMEVYDKDHDGTISLDEFKEILNDLAAKRSNNTRLHRLKGSMMNLHGQAVKSIDLTNAEMRRIEPPTPCWIRKSDSRTAVCWDLLQVCLLIYIAFDVPLGALVSTATLQSLQTRTIGGTGYSGRMLLSSCSS
jgi:hypothetical protein